MNTVNKRLTIGGVAFAFLCMTGGLIQIAAADDKMAQDVKTTQNAAPVQGVKEGARSQQLEQERVEAERNQAIQKSKTLPIDEALSAVQETRRAVDLLAENNPSQAKAALERALGKTDLVLSGHPNLALVPLLVDVRVVDINADLSNLKRIANTAKDLVKHSQFQAARQILRDFASEIDLTTMNLPIATYPGAIRTASHMIDQGKNVDAKMQLWAALQSLVVIEQAIPLPVIRAQALVDDVSHQVTEKKIDKSQANQLLSDADHQLAIAELLGYGTQGQDFKSLQVSINQIKDSINHDRDSKGLLAKVKSGLQAIKQKLSRVPASL